MTDRELLLLGLAAKAAGIKALRSPDGILRDCSGFDPMMNIFAAKPWNPLTDDGDAQRLAVKLRMNVFHAGIRVFALNEEGDIEEAEGHELDPYAATRRAITRAAAEIGKEMK
jgi:hypothetical protein